MDTRLQHPFTMIASGPTSCGKTFFVGRFLKYLDRICNVRFDRILVYYAEWQDTYENGFKPAYGKIEFHEGLPDPKDYSHDNSNKKLIIIDDLMRESSSNVVEDIFVRGSHHKSISALYLNQNLFHKGQRDISLNANYLVLFKNPRDRAQIFYLARQIYPENPKFIREIYFDATRRSFSYLFIDLKQSTPDELRFRACIFPDDERYYVYIPKKK